MTLKCGNILKVHHITTVILVGLCVASSGTPHNIIKRKSNTDPLTLPEGYPNCNNEGAIFPQQLQNVTATCQIWICHNEQWIPHNILSAYGQMKSLPGKSCKDISDTLRKTCLTEYLSFQNTAYWITVKDQCNEEETMQVYCDLLLDGGGWHLVWKHSYVEVTPRNSSMFWYSDFYKPCLDLNGGSDGWCNIPRKIRFNSTEMLIAAYHNGFMVYAYKGGFNRNIDYHWTGATLLEPTKIVDYCTRSYSQGVAPYPQKESTAITGLALAKWTGNSATDTIDGNGTDDDRWIHCQLPSSISSTTNNVQMTVAIFVR